MVKHRKLVASDLTPVTRDDKALGNVAASGMSFLASIGTPAKLERYWARSWIRKHLEDPDEVLEMLGLAEVEKRTEESEPVERAAVLAALPFPDRVVRCPDCNALPGAPCTVRDGSRAYTPGHVARHRRAEERS